MGTLLKVEKVLGLGSPASVAGVMEGDVLVTVQETLVTLMKHSEVSHNAILTMNLWENDFSHHPFKFWIASGFLIHYMTSNVTGGEPDQVSDRYQHDIDSGERRPGHT